jgi:holo-[acyl-carrier protein] synthase
VIIGLGIDALEKERFARVYQRFGLALAQRVCTPHEWQAVASASPMRQQAFCAGRFAAKEAMVKALGTGMANGLSWQHFNVLKHISGAPQAHTTHLAHTLCLQRSAGHPYIWHISLTDTAHSVMAVAVLEARAADQLNAII